MRLWALTLLALAQPVWAQTPAVTQDAFTQALASTYNTNPQLKAERASLQALDEQVAEAVSGFRPTIGAEYGRGRQRQAVSGTDWIYSTNDSRTLKIEQPIFQGGATLAQLKNARARVKAGRAHLLSVEQQVLFNAVSAYVDVAQTQAVRELSRANFDVLKNQRDATQSRYDAGDLPGTDVAQAASRLANAQSVLTSAESDVETARATFSRVAGYMPGELVVPEQLPVLPATLEEADAFAVQAFPDLSAAQMSEKAADAEVDRRTAKLLPSVALTGSMNRNNGILFPGISNYDNDSITLNVKVPLYQSGAEYAQIRAAESAREQARFTTLDTLSATHENTARAWHEYQAANAVIASAEEAVRAADLALTGMHEQYDSGTRTTLDVLNTEQDLFARQVDLVRARHNRVLAAYRLLAAVGKLNAKFLALPVEMYDPVEHYDDVKWLPLGF